MAKARTGINPLAYMGVEPSTPAQFVVDNRDPTTNDYENFNLQTVWLNKNTRGVWMLVSKEDFIATWIQFTSNLSAVNTLTGNIGGAVPALAGNINVVGAAPYVVTGNPGTYTLTISDNGTFATTYDGNIGSATPSSNILNVIGGTGVTVTGSGNTLTIDANSSNLEILTDLGVPVSPDASVLQVLGGDNITTTGIAPNVIEAAVSGTTNHAIQLGNASGSLTSVGPLTTGQLLIGVTGSDPNPARLTAGSNITIDDTSTPGEIVISSIGGGGGGIIAITKFTSSGIFTKNPNASQISVITWNGGWGGGGGRQGLSGQAGGGGGGPAGGVCVTFGPAALFDVNENVFIGEGGLGGSAQASASTDGNPGAVGGISYLGNIMGSGAAAGQTMTSGGRIVNTSGITSFFSSIQAPSVPTTYVSGGHGSINVGGNGGAGTGNTPAFDYAPTGGGGGGGADSVNIRGGGHGGHSYTYGSGSASVITLGGSGGIESGTIDGGDGNDFISNTGGRVVGATGGGGGGGQSLGLVAGNGGNGGIPGGGGGGGGGSLNGTNSGAGGDGGRGEVWVIEYA